MPASAIQRIEIYRLRVPLNEPFVIALETITHAENIALRIITRDGQAGWGECSPYRSILGETAGGAFAIAGELGRLWLGKDAMAIDDRLQELDAYLFGNAAIKSAFDMALYDLAARRREMPLCELLGGHLVRELRTDMTIGIADPVAMAEAAARLVAQGFDAVKVKLGADPVEDIARVRSIRDRIGPTISLRVDANQGWDFPDALRVLRAIAAFDIAYCEAPISRHLAHRLPELRRLSPIPLMADESLFSPHDAARLAAQGACDYFNIKLAKSGGIRNAQRIAAIAEGFGIACQVGCFSETRLGMSALAHFAAAHPAVRFHDMDAPLMLAEDPVQGGILYKNDGRITIPEASGHGAALDPDYLQGLAKTVLEAV